MGMPILYYRADQTKYRFPTINTSNATMRQSAASGDGAYYYTYNFYDNQALINMGMPWIHQLCSPLGTHRGNRRWVSDYKHNACPEEFYRYYPRPQNLVWRQAIQGEFVYPDFGGL